MFIGEQHLEQKEATGNVTQTLIVQLKIVLRNQFWLSGPLYGPPKLASGFKCQVGLL